MGSLFSGNRARGSKGGDATGNGTGGPGAHLIAGGFADDGSRPFPAGNDSETQRKLIAAIQARSGRASTNLSQPGTRSYTNTFLGSTS